MKFYEHTREWIHDNDFFKWLDNVMITMFVLDHYTQLDPKLQNQNQ
jgi:hypothetical protein